MEVFLVEECQGWGESNLLGVYSTVQKAEDRIQAFMLTERPGDWAPSDPMPDGPDVVTQWSWGSSGDLSILITRHTLDPVG